MPNARPLPSGRAQRLGGDVRLKVDYGEISPRLDQLGVLPGRVALVEQHVPGVDVGMDSFEQRPELGRVASRPGGDTSGEEEPPRGSCCHERVEHDEPPSAARNPVAHIEPALITEFAFCY